MRIQKDHSILKSIAALSLSVVLLLSTGGCGKDEDEKDYSGVGKLISDRNKARQKRASSNTHSDDDVYTPDSDSITSSSQSTSKRKSSGLTFEENVKIVSEKSGKTIAWATAYLDKSGRIVNIRIRKKR